MALRHSSGGEPPLRKKKIQKNARTSHPSSSSLDPLPVLKVSFALVVRWLPLEDVLRASSVCADWRRYLNTSPQAGSLVWRPAYCRLRMGFVHLLGKEVVEEAGEGGSGVGINSMGWRGLCATAYRERAFLRHPRWDRMSEASSAMSSCWHCLQPIEAGALRLLLPVFIHQTPPWCHASCDIM